MDFEIDDDGDIVAVEWLVASGTQRVRKSYVLIFNQQSINKHAVEKIRYVVLGS